MRVQTTFRPDADAKTKPSTTKRGKAIFFCSYWHSTNVSLSRYPENSTNSNSQNYVLDVRTSWSCYLLRSAPARTFFMITDWGEPCHQKVTLSPFENCDRGFGQAIDHPDQERQWLMSAKCSLRLNAWFITPFKRSQGVNGEAFHLNRQYYVVDKAMYVNHSRKVDHINSRNEATRLFNASP